MLFYTTSTFRETLAALTKKSKDGYMSVTKDVCVTVGQVHRHFVSKNIDFFEI